jgi:GNAT superfamily N-acetyltransferase
MSGIFERSVPVEPEYTLRLAELADLEAWMALVCLVRDNFPGLDTAEQLGGYRRTVEKNIARGTALCVTRGAEIVGILLYSLHSRCLSCMAVHPGHRRKGLASAMIERMLAAFPPGVDVSVTTFREEDAKGPAPRALYRRFGFEPGELITEFGYPHQRFVLHRP